MPMELLLELAQGVLPKTVMEPAEIDKLHVLAAAKLINVSLPEVDASEQVAEVHSITVQGKAALRRTYPNIGFDF